MEGEGENRVVNPANSSLSPIILMRTNIAYYFTVLAAYATFLSIPPLRLLPL